MYHLRNDIKSDSGFFQNLTPAHLATPYYVYDSKQIEKSASEYLESLGGHGLICFAVKANPNLSVLQLLGRLGCGADLVTAGELEAALRAGIPASKIVMSGVGKRPFEIEAALKAGILFFNVESLGELPVINDVAKRLGTTARICFRFNPDIDPKVHPYICTGLHENQFGIDKHTLFQGLDDLKTYKHIEFVGISQHIGSQMTEIGPMSDAVERVKDLLNVIQSKGLKIKWLNVGGGLGISYEGQTVPSIRTWVENIKKHFKTPKEDPKNGVNLVFEPGRSIVGDSGYLVTRVEYVKQTSHKRFAIVDGGMTELLRPALYGAIHPVVTPEADERNRTVQGPWYKYNIVGPICESSDCFVRDLLLPELKEGDHLIFTHAGAYGFSMSSNYNSRPKPAEYFLIGNELRMIRKPQTIDDLFQFDEPCLKGAAQENTLSNTEEPRAWTQNLEESTPLS